MNCRSYECFSRPLNHDSGWLTPIGVSANPTTSVGLNSALCNIPSTPISPAKVEGTGSQVSDNSRLGPQPIVVKTEGFSNA